MLIVNAVRVSKRMVEGRDIASYKVVVRMNEEVLFVGVVGGHDRALGWPVLLRNIAEAGIEAQKVERRIGRRVL